MTESNSSPALRQAQQAWEVLRPRLSALPYRVGEAVLARRVAAVGRLRVYQRTWRGKPRSARLSLRGISASLREAVRHTLSTPLPVATVDESNAPKPGFTRSMSVQIARAAKAMTFDPMPAFGSMTRPLAAQVDWWARHLAFDHAVTAAEYTVAQKSEDQKLWTHMVSNAIDKQLHRTATAAQFRAFYANVPQETLEAWITDNTPDPFEMPYEEWPMLSGGEAVLAIQKGWEMYNEHKIDELAAS